MNLKLAAIAAVVSIALFENASAAVPKPKAEGIYVADATIAMAPPRTTFALIEPNGEVWSAVDWYYSTFNALYGDINPKNGNGYGTEFVGSTNLGNPPVVTPLRITTAISEWFVRFTFYNETPPYGKSGVHHQLNPQGPRGAYDVDLNRQPNEGTPVIPSSVYTSNGFSMTVVGDQTNGSLNNCLFNGNLKDAPFFKRTVLTIKNNCYAPDGVTPVAKGTKLEGVLFTSQLVGFNAKNVYVLIAKAKTGNAYFGFSRTFPR